jgi:branched-chain amino acid transport system ATP-binding protein
MVLTARSVNVSYSDARVVHGVDVDATAGSMLAILGSNGAGKSSLVRALSGIVPSSATEITVNGTSLLNMAPDERSEYIAHVPEGRHVFGDHTVRQNLILGAYRKGAKQRAALLDDVLSVMPELSAHLQRRAASLSGGQQQMVAIGRGLMADTPVLVVDELTLGLAPIVAAHLGEALARLRDRGTAIILVEQQLALALRHADHVIVLEQGRVTFRGSRDEAAASLGTLSAAYVGQPSPRR